MHLHARRSQQFTEIEGADLTPRLTEIEGILSDEEALGAVTDEELVGLETELQELFDSIRAGDVEGVTSADVPTLTRIADAVDNVRSEAGIRLEAAEADMAAVAELEARLSGETTEPAPEAEAEPTIEAGDEPEPEVEPEPVAEVEPELEEVTASVTAPSLADLASRARRTPRQPAMQFARTEAPFIRALERNENVTVDDLARLFIEKRETFGAFAGQGEVRIPLGRIDIRDQFAPNHRLDARASMSQVEQAFESVTAGAMDPETWESDEARALTAAGGFCMPTEALYDIEQISGAQRPLRDSMGQLQADRGGYRFVLPSSLADISVNDPTDATVVSGGGAIGHWDNDDASGDEGARDGKSCQEVPCPTIEEAFVEAIYTCLGFDNFQGLTAPELVRKWILDAAAAWSREAETTILDSVSSESTPVTTTRRFSATIDMITFIIQLAAAERNRQRMPRNARLRVWLPSWVIELAQVDMIARAAGDGLANFQIDEAWVRNQLGRANVNVTFYEDTRTGAGQIFGAQGSGSDLRDFPLTAEWYLFHEGAHVHMEGGQLDFGLVRDSTLNQTNKYRIFNESLQGVLSRPIFSYRVRSVLCPVGITSGPMLATDADDLCASS
jgi:hypothetical protein